MDHNESKYQRPLNNTGRGAIRCRTFHTKLTDAAISYMDSVINEWIDKNPQIEIKFATSHASACSKASAGATPDRDGVLLERRLLVIGYSLFVGSNGREDPLSRSVRLFGCSQITSNK